MKKNLGNCSPVKVLLPNKILLDSFVWVYKTQQNKNIVNKAKNFFLL